MKLSVVIEKWAALTSGLSDKAEWLAWSNSSCHDWSRPLPKPSMIPSMQARRMSVPSRLAVEVALKLSDKTDVDFAIFISRHGELERTYKILSTLNQNQDISPTDFALSVHNTASGQWSIIGKQKIPITSISSSIDGFQQAFFEINALFSQGYQRILLIDFDGSIPSVYHSQINSLIPAYAVGFILTKGDEVSTQQTEVTSDLYQGHYPQSLAFLHGYLNKQKNFTLKGISRNWFWTRHN